MAIYWKLPIFLGVLVVCGCGSEDSSWDLPLDLRPSSSTYGKYETFTLSEDNNISIYVSPGVAQA